MVKVKTISDGKGHCKIEVRMCLWNCGWHGEAGLIESRNIIGQKQKITSEKKLVARF